MEMKFYRYSVKAGHNFKTLFSNKTFDLYILLLCSCQLTSEKTILIRLYPFEIRMLKEFGESPKAET